MFTMHTMHSLQYGFIGLCVFILLPAISPAGYREHSATTENPVVTTPEIADNPLILQVIFCPRKASHTSPPTYAQDLDITLEDGIATACRIFTIDKNAPTIIFFHGNGEIIEDYDNIAPMYLEQGVNFAIVEYRGYGWSEGSPLLSSFLADSNTSFLAVKEWLTNNAYSSDLFVMGRSLGSACAIDVAVQQTEDVKGLIIESGFAETLPLAKVLGLDLESMGLHEGQTFNNGGKIEQFDKPTFIIHGQYDQLIPMWQAERLHAACGARAKELQIVPGADHNSMILTGGIIYFQVIKKFIDKTTGATLDWRAKRKAYRQAEKQ